MFRNDAQVSAVCAALCDPLPALHGLWGPGGCSIAPTGLGAAFSGERVVWELSWALWNGYRASRKPCGLADLMRLDNDNWRRIGTLFVALADIRGSVAVDEWLEAQAPRLRARDCGRGPWAR